MDILNRSWSLQRFADGGDAAAADGGNGTESGQAAAQAETAVQGAAENQEAQEQAAKATFAELLKDPEYKRDYDSRVNRAVMSRMRAVQREREAITPLVDMLGKRYGIDTTDPGKVDYNALTQRFMADDALLEREAEMKGFSVEQLREDKLKDLRIQQLEREQAAAQREQRWAAMQAEADELKAVYPNFDLAAEMENEQFGRLLAALQTTNFTGAMKTAYETIHQSEIMGGAMKYAAQRTKEQVSNSLQSRSKRPAEAGSAPPASTATDPASLSAKQIEEIRQRVMRGEKVSFSS